TLIELMIVVGVIAVIAAFSIPRLLEGKNASYETTASSYLRTLHQSEVAYQGRNSRWATLQDLKDSNYLPKDDLKSYVVVLSVASDGSGFSATATPLVQPASMRFFFVDTSGVVRYSVGSPATATSQPIGG
ncbi:MAG TPA: type II secretion system protein, partial [Planctomycetota bacterium]|nr:type II secretion system protein [Planctomycetota bacterium]